MRKILYFIIIATITVCCNNPYKSLNNRGFAIKLNDTSVQLVDVRTADEFAAGHIPGAMNIDVKSDMFGSECDKLDKEKCVAVYCRSGVRSKTAALILYKKGFTVYNLRKGFNGWNGPVEK